MSLNTSSSTDIKEKRFFTSIAILRYELKDYSISDILLVVLFVKIVFFSFLYL